MLEATLHLVSKIQAADQPMFKEVYYYFGQINPEECTNYTAQETWENIERYNHVGPWDHKVPDALFEKG